MLHTTVIMSYFHGFHGNVSKHFQALYSSYPPQQRQKSSSCTEQFLPMRKKQPQLLAGLWKSFTGTNKLNQMYRREKRILTLWSHLITLQQTEGAYNFPAWASIIHGPIKVLTVYTLRTLQKLYLLLLSW